MHQCWCPGVRGQPRDLVYFFSWWRASNAAVHRPVCLRRHMQGGELFVHPPRSSVGFQSVMNTACSPGTLLRCGDLDKEDKSLANLPPVPLDNLTRDMQTDSNSTGNELLSAKVTCKHRPSESWRGSAACFTGHVPDSGLMSLLFSCVVGAGRASVWCSHVRVLHLLNFCAIHQMIYYTRLFTGSTVVVTTELLFLPETICRHNMPLCPYRIDFTPV